MASDASHVLEAALEQMDGIIAVPREDTPEMTKRLAQSPLSVSEDCGSEYLGPWLGRVWFLQWVWFLEQNQGLPSLFPSGIACSPLLLLR
ncbi:hypothetical protein G4228_000024 [Cervus hanglu yarkandensis]|nr:hypothetical protein G4228_000024 [Cervus hanglu yarkandensis]